MEKGHAIRNQIKTLVGNDEVIKDQTEINKNLYSFYQKRFSKNNDISRQKVLQYLQDKNLPKLNDNQCALCGKDVTEEEVKLELNAMEMNKSPGNDGVTKEFMKFFGITLKFISFSRLKWLFRKRN